MMRPPAKRPKLDPHARPLGRPSASPPPDDDDFDDAMNLADAQADDEESPLDEEPPPPGGVAAQPPPRVLAGDAAEEAALAACLAAVARPPLPPPADTDDATHPLLFMQTEADAADVWDVDNGATVRLFGVTPAGHSVMVRVRGYRQYLLVPAVPHVEPAALVPALNAALRKPGAVTDVSVVRDARSILYYKPGDPALPFFKITVALPRFLRDLSSVLSSGGVAVEGVTLPPLQTFEASVDYVLRFMIDAQMVGCQWVELPAGKYTLTRRDDTPAGMGGGSGDGGGGGGASGRSHTQLEAEVRYEDVVVHKPEGRWLLSAPLRRLSFDIECAGRKGVFPEPEHDPVIQIANYVSLHGVPSARGEGAAKADAKGGGGAAQRVVKEENADQGVVKQEGGAAKGATVKVEKGAVAEQAKAVGGAANGDAMEVEGAPKKRVKAEGDVPAFNCGPATAAQAPPPADVKPSVGVPSTPPAGSANGGALPAAGATQSSSPAPPAAAALAAAAAEASAVTPPPPTLDTEPGALHKVVFALNTCAPIVGATVLSFTSEAVLLVAWARFVRAVDPDVLTGYNIVNFDLPYLLNRAEALKAAAFPFLGRIVGGRTKMRSVQMSSSAFGRHESKAFTLDGRVMMDMLQVMTRDYKLRSYSLNSVAAAYIGEQKEDVHYSIITQLQAGDAYTRRRLAVYCLKDAILPQRLMDRLLSLTNYMEMARVTGMPLGWLLSRGHMIKVVSLLHRKAAATRLFIPDLPRSSGGPDGGGAGGGDGPQYDGATVITPKKGFYTDPIATLDFASLYPSIMMANNLCYSTLVRPADATQLRAEDYVVTPSGDRFVRPSLKKGTLSVILEELLAARKAAKRELAAATDPFLRAVLDGRQVALKVSANAVYGFTGAAVGKLPCMEISASTTAYGREMIELTRAEVEKLYPGASVIYGDTDSVMIKFGAGMSLADAMARGREAAGRISALFPSPVKLEFEKCYFPYLLISKKRYAGQLWTNPDAPDKMDTKGVESVRRDNCRLVANVIDSVLRILLEERDLNAAVSYVKGVIGELLQNRLDISLLVVSKQLTKAEGKYESNTAHSVLAEKMRRRDPGTAPSLGDRVPYVITRGVKSQPAYDRAEDPLYALDHNVAIDNAYYLDNMLRKPLERIFEAMLPPAAVAALFSGDHTRSIFVPTPTARSGGMMRFTRVALSCLGCKSAIPSGALCKHCAPREAEIYARLLGRSRSLEAAFASLWTECQRCMGSVCQEVLCSNVDCPIFYRRLKTQKDLDDASKKLERFAVEW